MPALPPEEAVKTFDEVLLGYSREEAIAEARRALTFDLARSSERCPLDVDVQLFVEAIADGDFNRAVAVIREAHAWPEVFGRHCHKYCELAHNPGGKYFAPEAQPSELNSPFISALEWAAGRYGDASLSPFRPGSPTGRRVVVLGAGSAGLACAWELRRQGHDVHIFDPEAVPGGLLWTGYPSFRLTKSVVPKENDPREWGADLHAKHAVDGDELREMVEDYDAVFIGVGRVPTRSLGIEGDELDGVWTGLDILRDTWYGRPPALGPRVMIIGAGFAALDVARTAIRFGCSPVEIVYRRGVADMLRPGLGPIFVRTLEEEGVRFRFMEDPKRIIGVGGHVAEVELVRTEYAEGQAEGRRAVRPVPGSEHRVAVDTVIRAIGESIDVGALVGPVGVELTDQRYIKVDRVTRQTSNPKVWAGGDVIGGNGNEGAAVDGLWAARAMDAFFTGRLETWRAEAAERVKDMRWI